MINFRTILKYTGLALIGLIIALLLLPYVFKDKLVAFLKQDINKQINAVVEFNDADISFISSFPDVRINVDNLKVTGIDDFDGIVLYSADQTRIDFNLTSLFGENNIPKINNIELIQPEINVIILDSIRANYLIFKDTASTSFKLELDEYNIKNGKITYQDNSLAIFTVLENVNHSGTGDFTQDIFDLDTNTDVEKLSFKYAGSTYLKDVKTKFKAGLNINFPEQKYTFKDNVLKLNELDITGQGFIQLKGDDVNIDVIFNTASEQFKSFLSMIPNAYTTDFKDVKTSGNASMKGNVKGNYNGLKNELPAFDITIKVDNGYARYPALTKEIKDVFADINIKATRPDYMDLVVNIPSFSIKIGGDHIKGRLIASNLTTDQKVEGFLKGNLDLNNLIAAFPMHDVEQLRGNIQCDLDFKAKMSDVNDEKYEAISFLGKASAKDIMYKSKSMPVIKISHATVIASPQFMHFNGNDMQLGKSDLNLKANIKNPLALMSTTKNAKIDIEGESRLFDLNEWMNNTKPTAQGNMEQAEVIVDEELIKNASLNLKLKGNKVIMNEFVMDDVSMDANLAANAMDVRNFELKMQKSDVKINGNVINAYDYLFNNGFLDGDLNFFSNNFDSNQFLTSAERSSPAAPISVIPVPKNVRIKIQTEIKNLLYTNLRLEDFKGELEVINEEVMLKNLVTKTLGGNLALEGLYGTKNLSSPDFSVKLDLSKIKYIDAINSFEIFKKLAPIAEYLDGFFNTTLIMKGKLGGQMMPDISSLDASGFLETLNGTIKGYTPISTLSEKLGIKELKELNFVNTRNWFEIVKGYVELKEFNKVIKGVDMTISGKHGFGKSMDYNLDLIIPREMLKKSKITGTAESGLSFVEKEAAKLGLNVSQGPNIFLNVKITGNIKSPQIKITPKTSKGGTISDAVTSKVEETVSNVKDTIQKEIKKAEDKFRDTLTKKANEELEKAKQKAEAAAQKGLDSLKSKAKTEVINKIDTLTKGAIPDSLKQKAKDVLNKKSTEEVDKIKEKLKDFNPFKKKGKG